MLRQDCKWRRASSIVRSILPQRASKRLAVHRGAIIFPLTEASIRKISKVLFGVNRSGRYPFATAPAHRARTSCFGERPLQSRHDAGLTGTTASFHEPVILAPLQAV